MWAQLEIGQLEDFGDISTCEEKQAYTYGTTVCVITSGVLELAEGGIAEVTKTTEVGATSIAVWVSKIVVSANTARAEFPCPVAPSPADGICPGRPKNLPTTSGAKIGPKKMRDFILIDRSQKVNRLLVVFVGNEERVTTVSVKEIVCGRHFKATTFLIKVSLKLIIVV